MSKHDHVLTQFERAVLEKLLAGDHPVLGILRDQLDQCHVKSRESTGHGFFTNFEVDRFAGPPPAPVQRIRIDDVGATINGLKHGAGFVLFVVDGYMDFLEGFSYDEPWPPEVVDYSLRYEGERSRSPGAIDFSDTPSERPMS